MKLSCNRFERGFALAATLIVLLFVSSALVFLLWDAKSLNPFKKSELDRIQLDLCQQSALAECESKFRDTMRDDAFWILYNETPSPTPYLFSARAENRQFTYLPLFSCRQQQLNSETWESPKIEIFLTNPKDHFQMIPYLKPIALEWIEIKNEKKKPIARYSYWIEDLQSKLDLSHHGNTSPNGTHRFPVYPEKLSRLGESEHCNLSTYLIDPQYSDKFESPLEKTIYHNKSELISPLSMFAAADLPARIARNDIGELELPIAASLEKNAVHFTSPYLELPRIPPHPNIQNDWHGRVKLNLNELIQQPRNESINRWKQHILAALPQFEQRKGAFPDDYVATLGANALDYADKDSDCSYQPNEYRGLDAFPLVNEFLIQIRWEQLEESNGYKWITFNVSCFAEFWNMTNQEIDGNAQVSYENDYETQLPDIPRFRFSNLEHAKHELIQQQGKWWFPAIRIRLSPNAFTIRKLGNVSYRIPACQASFFLASPITLSVPKSSHPAGYQLKWNGTLVDQSRRGLERTNVNLHFPKNTLSKPRQAVRLNACAHTYSNGVNALGDIRSSFYADSSMRSYAYPENFSPLRRNLRFGTVYRHDPKKVHGRVLPSEWPDGGHDSAYGDNRFYTENDQRISPDDAIFIANPPEPESTKFISKISNSGIFHNEIELGNVFDPLFWNIKSPQQVGQNWGDVLPNTQHSTALCGGNTLRIGRPEHPKFESTSGQQARHLLDLFYAGSTQLTDRGEVLRKGSINLNTATPTVLLTLLEGPLGMDPALEKVTSTKHETTWKMAPETELTRSSLKNKMSIVEAIIKARPLLCESDLIEITDDQGEKVFGNKMQYPQKNQLVWTDSAAEEAFGKLYINSTLRSRNFRIWITSQLVGGPKSDQVLAEQRKVIQVFIDRAKNSPPILHVLYENDF